MLFDICLLPKTFIIARGESKGRWRHCFILLTQLKQPDTLTLSLQDVVACLPANRKDPNDNNAKVPWYRGFGIQVRLLTVQKPKLPMAVPAGLTQVTRPSRPRGSILSGSDVAQLCGAGPRGS